MPSLPQNDPNSSTRAMRANALMARRAQLAYEHHFIDPVAMARAVPSWHRPGLPWLRAVGGVVLTILRNIHALHGRNVEGMEGMEGSEGVAPARVGTPDATTVQHIQELEALMSSDLEGVAESPAAGLVDLEGFLPPSFADAFLQALKAKVAYVFEAYQTSAVAGRATTIASYDELFQTVPRPSIASDFESDEMFAWQRVAGVNPTMIERVTGAVAGFAVSDAHLAAALGDVGDTLALAGAEGRLYVAQYAMFNGLQGGSFPTEQKYLFGPVALFAVARAGVADRRLRPVAIQCAPDAVGDHAVITPADGDLWRIAKAIVQMSDGNHHEAIAHLGRTHLFVEPFVIATDRQLSVDHPVGVLLRPHFEGTLFINDAAQSTLISAHGVVDMLLGGTIEVSRTAVNLGRANLSFASYALPVQLRSRGVDDPACLPDYPYRDDALLLWHALHEWVTSYLALYYRHDDDVRADFELQAWAAELASPDGGRVEGFGEAGGIATLAYLTEALTTVMFTASVQHAAVNFPQATVMAYPPAMPLALYAPFPGGAGGYMGLLPPLKQALVQLHVTYLLGSVHHTRLGQYEPRHFEDHRVEGPLAVFQQALRRIEQTVHARNQTRRPYTVLLPSMIPQSINI